MTETNKAGSIEAFDSSVPRRVARISADKTYFRPHVLDVRNHICDIEFVKLNFPGVGKGCNFCHVSRVVWL